MSKVSTKTTIKKGIKTLTASDDFDNYIKHQYSETSFNGVRLSNTISHKKH